MKKIIGILGMLTILIFSFGFAQNDTTDKRALKGRVQNKVNNYQDKSLSGNVQHQFSGSRLDSLSEANKKALEKVRVYVKAKLQLVDLVQRAANRVKIMADRIGYNSQIINGIITKVDSMKQSYKDLPEYIIENKLDKTQINALIKEYNETMKEVIISLKSELNNIKQFLKNK